VKAGGLIVFIARFTYGMDDSPALPLGDGYADRRELREFAFAVDPSVRRRGGSCSDRRQSPI
jgi:hypothetical protein